MTIPPPHTVDLDRPVNRDKQCSTLRDCLAPLADHRQPRHAYVHGPPGTGKTMAVTHILDDIRGTAATPIHAVRVNCCTFQSRTGVFEVIDRELTGDQISDRFGGINAVRDRVDAIRGWAGSDDGTAAVVVLDDIDMLEEPTRVLHDLLEIARVAGDGFGVVGVGNEPLADLDVGRKAVSRWQPVEVRFPSYAADELEDIVAAYVPAFTGGTDLQVQDAAVEEVAERAVEAGGDVRTAKRVLYERLRAVDRSDEQVLTVQS